MRGPFSRFVGATLIASALLVAAVSEFVAFRGARTAVAVADFHASVSAQPTSVFRLEQVQDLVIRAASVASPPVGLTLGSCLVLLIGCVLFFRSSPQPAVPRAAL
jgi:hypothetical protein